MNKYTARALHEQAAVHGHRVLVVTQTQNDKIFAFQIMDDESFPEGIRGEDKTTTYESGGTLGVASEQYGDYLNHRADIVFIDSSERYDLDDDVFLPCLQGSKLGEIVRA